MQVSAAASMMTTRRGSTMPAKRAGLILANAFARSFLYSERPVEVLDNVLACAPDLVVA